jgi:4-amino-4-deoxy-L-arabinose transferase-like glycosyltransferase
VGELLREKTPQDIQQFSSDSTEYLALAHQIAQTGRYVSPEKRYLRYWGLIRTPGYPVFCALFDRLGWSPAGILRTQALLGGGMTLLVYWLGRSMLGSRWLGMIAGVCSALSPTGLQVVQPLLTDLLFAAIFLAGFTCFCAGIVRHKRRWLLVAALLFVAAVLTKPTLLFWPLCVPVIWIVLARGYRRPVRPTWVLTFVLIQTAGMGAWCLRNYAAEGTFSFCAIDGWNLRYWVAPIVREWQRKGKYPKQSLIANDRHAASVREGEMLTSGMPPARIAHELRMESLQIFRRSPWLTFRVYLDNIVDQLGLTRSFDRYDRDELNDSPARRILIFLDALTYPMWTAWLFLGLGAGALVAPLTVPRSLRDDQWRKNFAFVIVLAVVYLSFMLMAGTTNHQGPRILYPAEFALILLDCSAAGGLAALGIRGIQLIRSKRDRDFKRL